MQGRQGIEATGRLSSRCPSAVKLSYLIAGFSYLMLPLNKIL